MLKLMPYELIDVLSFLKGLFINAFHVSVLFIKLRFSYEQFLRRR